MKKRSLMAHALLWACVSVVVAQSAYPGTYGDKFKVAVKVPLAAESFELQDVRLLPSRFRDNLSRDSAWMVSIGTDRLLHSFRTTAGVHAGREGGYMTVKKLGGWESLDCELRGHTTGHLLSAFALMYAATGADVFRLKGDSLVAGLAEVQAAHGNGYLSAFPEELVNRNIRGTSVWAPWYTLHKILAGLIDQYLYAGNAQALDVARKMGGWAYAKLKPLSEETRRKMLRNEFGGMNEAFYNLYALTGDGRYRWLAGFFYHDEVVDPLKARTEDFGTKHTNTFIPKVLAEARNYELSGEAESKTASEFFWHAMVARHTFAPGCSSDKEHFFPAEEFGKHISGYTGETCCTYNMLKLTRHLFCWDASPELADYYERALYNHILGQQDPATGMVAYFLPLQAGTHKVYSTPENSFWCCVGSGFESHAKYAEAIYYHNAEDLFVNLFIPSEVRWAEKGLTLRQETRFPEEETVSLTMGLDEPQTFAVKLRYPSWSGNVDVRVNGRRVKVRRQPEGYIKLARRWEDGDRIEVTYPMRLTLERVPGDAGRGAVFYGPVLLAGMLGSEGMQPPAPYSNPTLYNDYYTYDYHIPERLSTCVLEWDEKKPGLRRMGAGLEFVAPNGMRLCPLYDIHRQRYVVYWDLAE